MPQTIGSPIQWRNLQEQNCQHIQIPPQDKTKSKRNPTRLELLETTKNVMPTNVKLNSLIQSPEKVVLRGFQGHSKSQCTGFLSVYNSIGRELQSTKASSVSSEQPLKSKTRKPFTCFFEANQGYPFLYQKLSHPFSSVFLPSVRSNPCNFACNNYPASANNANNVIQN